jgi:hypothetical protein
MIPPALKRCQRRKIKNLDSSHKTVLFPVIEASSAADIAIIEIEVERSAPLKHGFL